MKFLIKIKYLVNNKVKNKSKNNIVILIILIVKRKINFYYLKIKIII